MIGVVAKKKIKPGRVDEFIKVAEELIAGSNNEKGCIEYILMVDSKEENTLTFLEKWEDMNHLEAHFETPHFKKVVPLLQELTLEGEVNIYKEI